MHSEGEESTTVQNKPNVQIDTTFEKPNPKKNQKLSAIEQILGIQDIAVSRITRLAGSVANEKIVMAKTKLREVQKFQQEIEGEALNLMTGLKRLKAKFKTNHIPSVLISSILKRRKG